jgi:hypothetical protein
MGLPYKNLLLLLLIISNADVSIAQNSAWDIQVSPKPSFFPNNRSRREVSVHYSKVSKVSIFVKPFCTECEEAIGYFRERTIPYEQVDSLVTLTGIASLTLSSERPPITIIDYSDGTRRRIVGFDKAIFDTVLGEYRSNQDSFAMGSDFDTNNKGSQNASDSFDLR